MYTNEDMLVEAEIKSLVSSGRWANGIKSRTKLTRALNYFIGGLAVNAYETVPYQQYQDKLAELVDKGNVVRSSVYGAMKFYRTCRQFEVGTSFAEEYGASATMVFAKYANNDKDKFIEGIEYAKTYSLAAVKRSTETGEAPVEVTHIRFSVTPMQKEEILNILDTLPGTHQGQKLVELVNEYIALKYSVAA